MIFMTRSGTVRLFQANTAEEKQATHTTSINQAQRRLPAGLTSSQADNNCVNRRSRPAYSPIPVPPAWSILF